MLEDPYSDLLSFLEAKRADYKTYEHEPVITSEEAREIKRTDATGLKSLLFKTENGLVLLVLPGEKKVSSKKARSYLDVKDIRMVTPDEVLSAMGCEVGGCYPIGEIAGIRTVLDESIKEAESLIFNVGRRDRSVEITRDEFERVTSFEWADIAS